MNPTINLSDNPALIAEIDSADPASPLRGMSDNPAATYDYKDGAGKLIFQKFRPDGSMAYRERRPDPENPEAWIDNMEGVEPVLYRLDLLKSNPDQELVYVCGSEKGCDRLAKLDVLTTTNPGGAGHWKDEFSPDLADKVVVIIPDNDDPGRSHAEDVLRSVSGHTTALILELPGLPEGGDVSDWLEEGGVRDQFFCLVEARLAEVVPPAKAEAGSPSDPPRASTSDSKHHAPESHDHQGKDHDEAGVTEAPDELGDRFAGESVRVEGSDVPVLGLGVESSSPSPDEADMDIDAGDDPVPAEATLGVTAHEGAVPTAFGVAEISARTRQVVEGGDLKLLYNDAGLLAALGGLEQSDPAAYAGLKLDLDGMKGFKSRDFAAAVKQHRPAGVVPPESTGKAADIALLMELAGEKADLFLDPAGKPYATTRAEGKRETLGVRTAAYKQMLKAAYYDRTGSMPGPEAFRSALEVLEVHAGREPAREVAVRTAGRRATAEDPGAASFIDLADAERRVVRVNKDGWAIEANPPVLFRRMPGMLPLPEPTRGVSIDALWPYLNVRPEDRPLLLAWLTNAFLATGPYPVLIVNGEQGTAKSTSCKVVRGSIDPHVTPLRGLPKDEQQLMIAAGGSGMLAFDNVSALDNWQSDALCRIATGGGFSTRQLYTDEEEVHIKACKPILFNGIEDMATRGDLLQRSIHLELPVIPDDRRRDEGRFWRAFEADQPGILGALLDLLAGALAALPGIQLARMPRMADFALWGEAVHQAAGGAEGQFLRLYEANLAKTGEICLESSPVAMAVLALMADRPEWTGTAQELLSKLENRVQANLRRRNWPASARGLGGQLRRYAPALRAMGVVAEFAIAGDRKKTRTIILRSERQEPTSEAR